MTDRIATLLVLFALLLTACDQTTPTQERVITPASISEAEPTNTPLPSPVPTNTPAPTVTPIPTVEELPTEVPTDVPTEAPTATLENVSELNGDDRVIRITVASANLRAGPGLTFDTVGVVLFNDAFVVVEQDDSGLWYLVQLNDGTTGWVAASVTEDVSSEVYAALISTPDAPEDGAEPTAEAAEEPTPIPSPTPLLAQVVFPSVNLREGPGLEFDIVGYVFEGDVYTVEEQDDTGSWIRVTVSDGTTGWIATSTTAIGVDTVVTITEDGAEQTVAAGDAAESNRGFGTTTEQSTASGFATLEASEPSTTSNTTSTNTSSTASADTTESSTASTTDSAAPQLPAPASDGTVSEAGQPVAEGGILPNGSRVPITGNHGRSDDNPRTALYPGSSLYFDENNTGFGAGLAIAPSGPDPRVLEENQTKVDVAEGYEPTKDFLPGRPRIMLIGDGITSGKKPMANGYRRFLYNMLKDGGHAFDFVGTMNTHTSPVDFDSDHEGHVNYRADQILAGLSKWAGLYPPDVAVIHIGTNDLLQGQSVESTVQDVQLIIQTLRYHNPNIKIVLSHIIPTTDSWVNGLINKYNVQLNAISWSQNTGNSPIYLVQQHNGFRASLDTYDGIHPNAQGSEKMARNFYGTLNRLFLISR